MNNDVARTSNRHSCHRENRPRNFTNIRNFDCISILEGKNFQVEDMGGYDRENRINYANKLKLQINSINLRDAFSHLGFKN